MWHVVKYGQGLGESYRVYCAEKGIEFRLHEETKANLLAAALNVCDRHHTYFEIITKIGCGSD